MKTFLDEPGAYVAGDRITRCLEWGFEPTPHVGPDNLIAVVRRFLDALERCNAYIRM